MTTHLDRVREWLELIKARLQDAQSLSLIPVSILAYDDVPKLIALVEAQALALDAAWDTLNIWKAAESDDEALRLAWKYTVEKKAALNAILEKRP